MIKFLGIGNPAICPSPRVTRGGWRSDMSAEISTLLFDLGFINMTGRDYIPMMTGRTYEVEMAPVHCVGKYWQNNGVLAAVDQNKKTWIAEPTKERYEALERAGLKEGSVYVPLSNNESVIVYGGSRLKASFLFLLLQRMTPVERAQYFM